MAMWRQLIPKLSTLGLAKQVHAQVLARYCELLVLWVDCVAFTRKNGRSYAVRADPTNGVDSEGKRKEKPGRILGFRKFPEVDMMIKVHKELLIIEREFGGTPAAETRVKIEIERAAKGDVGDIKSRFFAPPQSRNAAS